VKVSAVVPAAGLGLRLKYSIAKPLALVNNIPIIVHTLKRLCSHPLISEIIVVFNAKDISELKRLLKKNRIKKIKDVVEGGSTRTQSVKNGLKILGETDYVLIHDGVRPFIKHEIITQAIKAAKRYGAAVTGLPLKSTIKRINPKNLEVEYTLRRNEIMEVQTPQVFKKDLIIRAYTKADDKDAPDDAFLVECLKRPVKVIEGSCLNIKITTPEDLLLAQAIDNLIGKRKL
jgi:2-C-methyl-D-erythritol 4-phosphate cytidylyltransferase